MYKINAFVQTCDNRLETKINFKSNMSKHIMDF